MKIKHLLLLGLIAAFSSCSTSYRTGQTPDDVYYSPAPAQAVYVTTNNQEDKDRYAYNNTYNSEDLAIRRGISDPRYRSNLTLDLGYGYSPYGYSPYGYNNTFGYNNGYYNPYNYNYNNSYGYYAPYYNNFYASPYYDYYYSPQVYIVSKPGITTPIAPRRYNLGAYSNRTNTTSIFTHGNQPINSSATSNAAPARTFKPQPANNGRGVGNFIRRVFTPENNNSNNNTNPVYRSDNSNYNNNSSPARSTPSVSPSSSSSSGSSSAPVRTFKR
ncbi:MAG: hypothetical protein M3Z92_10810 [Bacteroidota bacterium]|nr:hypothetical protein [Bacteroidota bacterium]